MAHTPQQGRQAGTPEPSSVRGGMREETIVPRTDRSRARAEGLDHLGYGFVGWQMPLALLLIVMSCTWTVGALLDSFTGQTTCETGPGGRVAHCRTENFASLYADGRTSPHPHHAARYGGQFDQSRAASRRPRAMPDSTGAPGPNPQPTSPRPAGPAPGPSPGSVSGPGPGPGPSGSGRRILQSQADGSDSVADSRCLALVAAVGCDFDLQSLFNEQAPSLVSLHLSASSCRRFCQPVPRRTRTSKPWSPLPVQRVVKPALRRTLAEETNGVHPDNIRLRLAIVLSMYIINLLLLSNGIHRHPAIELHAGFSGPNLHAVVKLTVALALAVSSGATNHVMRKDAPTAMSRLQELHEIWLEAGDLNRRDPSNFDPFTAAAYCSAGTWIDSTATVLLLMALVEQVRAVSPAKEGEVIDMLPIHPKTASRRKKQAVVFVAGWLYLSAGAVYYRLAEEETFTTLSQSVYFTLITCTTIGYGEMTPNTTAGRFFLIFYSMFGIALVGMVVVEMGDVLVCAFEWPTGWFMRNIVLKLRPAWFPGLDAQTWDSHITGLSTAEVHRRVVWVGRISSGEPVTEEYLRETLQRFADINQISIHAKDRSWALVTFCQPDAANQGAPSLDYPAERAIETNRGVDTHVVLPATRSAIGRQALQEGSALHSRVRLAAAVFVWLLMLCGIGPLYGMHAHSWDYSEALYFSYVTMSTLGYGDFFPNDRGSRYQASCTGTPTQQLSESMDSSCFSDLAASARCEDMDTNQTMCEQIGCEYYGGSTEDLHHHVFVWCLGTMVLTMALSAFSFVLVAVGNHLEESKERRLIKEQAERVHHTDRQSHMDRATDGQTRAAWTASP